MHGAFFPLPLTPSCRDSKWQGKRSWVLCGNKMPTRCNRGFYCRSYCLLNMFRSPLCPQLRVMRPVCRMLQHSTNRTHNPQLHTRPATWKTTARDTTGSNHCIIILSSWWWAYWCPKHVEQAIRSVIKTSVASSWHFISTLQIILCFYMFHVLVSWSGDDPSLGSKFLAI